MVDKTSEPSIGIDLGTTFSVVGVWQNEKVEIIPNLEGKTTTPSFVAFKDSERIIGDSAKAGAARNPLNTIFDVKRLIGRKFNDKSVQEDLKSYPFKVIADKNGNPKIVV